MEATRQPEPDRLTLDDDTTTVMSGPDNTDPDDHDSHDSEDQ